MLENMVMQTDYTYKDELTNLYNRRYLYLLLDREFKRARRYGEQFSIILLDIDDFKEINDTYGHLTGDGALVSFAHAIESSIRESDVPVRYGGDEFLVLLPNTDEEAASIVAKRIIEITKQLKAGNKKMSCSAGLATFPKNANNWEALFSHADRGVYAAKRAAKGTIGVVSSHEPVIKLPTAHIIGRREEIKWVKERLTDGTKMHFVYGETGIGKTRLITETVKADSFMFARGTPFGALHGIPYFAVKELLKNFYASYKKETETAYEKLNSGQRIEIRKLLPALSTETQSPGDADKYRLYGAVASFLSELGKKRRAIILLDDLQWIDEAGGEMLFYLIKILEGNVTIFGAYRNEEIKGTKTEEIVRLLGREGLYDIMELLPISSGSVIQMTETILQGKIDGKFANYIKSESGGNPFFIEEIIKNLKKNHAIIYGKDQEWHITGIKSEHLIPRGIEDVLNRKLSALNSREKLVLEYAGVIGKIFEVQTIKFVSGMKEGEIYDILDNLVKTGILREIDAGTYEFSEGVIIGIVLGNIIKGRLKMMHQKAAEVLEETYKEHIDEHAEEIAYHYHEGFKGDKLSKYAEWAGDKSMQVYAYDSAIKYYLWAIEVEKDSKIKAVLYKKLGDAYGAEGDFENALKAYNTGLKINPADTWDFYKKIGDVHYQKGIHQKALQFYKKSKQSARKREQKLICNIDIAEELREMDKINEAEGILIKTISEIKDKDQMARAYNVMGNIYSNKNEYENAKKHYLKSIKLCDEIHNMKGLATAYNNIGLLLEDAGRYKRALFYLKKSLDIVREMDYKFLYAIVTLNMGAFYSRIGDYENAMQLYQKSADIGKSIGSNKTPILVYDSIGDIKYKLNNVEEAISYRERAFKIANSIQDYPSAFRIALRLTDMHGEIGDFNKAYSYLKEAETYLQHIDSISNKVYYFTTLSGLLEMQRKYVEATEVLRKTLKLSRKSSKTPALQEYPYTAVDMYLRLSRLQALLKNKRSSRVYLGKVLNSNLCNSSRAYNRAPRDFEIGRIYFYQNNLVSALKYLKQSERIFKKLHDLHSLLQIKEILRQIKKVSK